MSMTRIPALLLQGDAGDAIAGIAALGFGLVMMMVWLVLAAVFIIGMWKVFSKAGKPGWACLVPIYNVIVLLEIVGRPIWWLLLMFIPLVNIAFIVIVYIDLAKSFGQSAVFFLLFLVGGIGFLLLGFGNYRYLGPAGAAGQFAPGTTG